MKRTRLLLCLCVAMFLSACTLPLGDVDSTPAEPYADLLTALADAFPWKNDEDLLVPDYSDLSYLYAYHDDLSDIGYTLVDLDGNGQQELLLSAVDAPFIYDLYTVRDGKVVSLFSSGERYRHTVYDNGYVECVVRGCRCMGS